MKYISSGWQYAVYDLGNGRVHKKFHSYLGTVCIMTKDILVDYFHHHRHSLSDIPSLIVEMREFTQHSIVGIRNHPEIKKEWLGNPTFKDNFDYEQDFATTIRDYIITTPTMQKKYGVIDLLVMFCYTLYSHGVIEKTFDIGQNFGINEHGEIVLIDLGELVFNKKFIEEQLTLRVWAKPSITAFFPSNELCGYFIEKMDAVFSFYKKP